mmetsp:Transcript_29371/g.43863  ORF Transcript_29371/g.43863 Transcript_29371/m.43863 type:complete len:366 (+) Transcript_29371:344-1441(+)
MRWADTDSDDSDDEFQATHPSRSGSAMGNLIVNPQVDSTQPPDQEDDQVSVASSSSEEEEDEELEQERQKRLEELRKAQKEAQEEEEKKKKALELEKASMSKKDRKKMELNDLDDLLGEFGIDTAETNETEEKKGDDADNTTTADAAAAAGAADSSKSKKKKKKKKKGGNNKSNNNDGDDWVQVDAPVAEGGENAAPVDVAAVLKAKATKKVKSAAEIAASTAAKEAKAKAAKQAEADKKKKKKEQKKKAPGMQAPYRLSDDLVAVVGKSILPRPQVTQALWKYIRENDLQNPEDKREILCDAKLKRVLGGNSKVTMFSMNKYITAHLLEKMDKSAYVHVDIDSGKKEEEVSSVGEVEDSDDDSV